MLGFRPLGSGPLGSGALVDAVTAVLTGTMTATVDEDDITTGGKLLMTDDMFSNCGIDYLPDFETSGVQSCYNMFGGVKNMRELMNIFEGM